MSKESLQPTQEKPRRLTRWLVRFPVLILIGMFAAGIVFWGGFHTALDVTNTEAFCVSCHEMEANVYREYQKTVHYNNRTGIRATCPDCHVPRDWAHMVARKIGATNELFHHFAGSLDTHEKFLAKRLKLAEGVWTTMRANDSRECRNCHDLKHMELKQQNSRARITHQRAAREQRTCIDCHMGIAHKIAREFDQNRSLHDRFQQEHRPCSDCHRGMPMPADW